MAPANPCSQEPCLARQQDLSEDCRCWSDPEDLRCNKSEEQPSTPLPKLQLALLLSMMIAEPVTAHVMLPFIVQLIEETGVTGGDVTKVGYYTGMVDSLFFFAEALMILQWGRLSDRIGRRPVLLTGLFGLGISMLSFGLSHTFLAVVASRIVAGLLNGNVGVVQCMLGEITDETNVAQAFAMIPLAWYAGNTISPLIGGLLQHPYERIGGVFRHSEFWRRNPYFLPCATVALITVTSFTLNYFFLEETAGPFKKRAPHPEMHHARPQNDSMTTERTPLLPSSKPSSPSLRSLATPRVVVVMINYSLLAIVEISFCVLQPLFYSTPIIDGGLGMSPLVIGTCLSGYGIANAAVSTFFFAPLTKRFGKKNMTTACIFGFFGCFALFPLMNALARIEYRMTPVVWATFAFQLALGTLHPMAFSCICIYLRSAAAGKALGATIGLAQTSTSIMRAIGPGIATSLFAVSIQFNLLGGGLVYVLMSFLAAAATMATLLLPEKPWDVVEDE